MGVRRIKIVRIQSLWRRALVRHRMEQRSIAAVQIQKLARGFQARNRVKLLKLQLDLPDPEKFAAIDSKDVAEEETIGKDVGNTATMADVEVAGTEQMSAAAPTDAG